MQRNVTAFSFPTLRQARNLASRTNGDGAWLGDEAAVKAAIERGYADGFEQGRIAAEATARQTADTARTEGFEQARAEGLAQMRPAVEALARALQEFDRERAASEADAEAFCVDLALAIVGRLVEVDTVRSDFVERAARAALKVLAPESATAIFLNPSDRTVAGDALKRLPIKDDPGLAPGHVRVEAGHLVVEGAIDKAFEELRNTAIEVKYRRTRPRAAGKRSKR